MRVTEILSITREGNYFKEGAADLGSAVHKAIEYFLLDDLDEESLPEIVKPYFNSWLKRGDMLKDNKAFLLPETRLEGKLYNGCPDYISQDSRGFIFIDDWKTGQHDARYYYQLAAYGKLFKELYPGHITILRLWYLYPGQPASIIDLTGKKRKEAERGWDLILAFYMKHKNNWRLE